MSLRFSDDRLDSLHLFSISELQVKKFGLDKGKWLLGIGQYNGFRPGCCKGDGRDGTFAAAVQRWWLSSLRQPRFGSLDIFWPWLNTNSTGQRIASR